MEQRELEIALKSQLDAGKDYYEIRLESIGGLGANLCGKMLGELGIKYLVGIKVEYSCNTQQQQRPRIGEHLLQQRNIMHRTVHSQFGNKE